MKLVKAKDLKVGMLALGWGDIEEVVVENDKVTVTFYEYDAEICDREQFPCVFDDFDMIAIL